LSDYKVPTFEDVPEEFESILIEDGNGPGPYGAKGLGEARHHSRRARCGRMRVFLVPPARG